jgi:hypothetical protein
MQIKSKISSWIHTAEEFARQLIRRKAKSMQREWVKTGG